MLRSHLTLALWQFRQSWHFLFLTGIGMLAAVILVCSIPLYSRVALSAGLRTVLADTPGATAITVRSPAIKVTDAEEAHDQTLEYDIEFAQYIGDFLSTTITTESVLQTAAFSLRTSTEKRDHVSPEAQVALRGYDIRQVTSHISIRAGRLPREQANPQDNTLEIALPTSVATLMNISLGAEFAIAIHISPSRVGLYYLPLRVVGLIEPRSEPDLFWQRTDFHFTPIIAGTSTAITPPSSSQAQLSPILAHALVSSDAFLTLLDTGIQQAEMQRQPHHVFRAGESTIPGNWTWFYHLDPLRLDVERLPELLEGLDTIHDHLPVINSPLDSLQAYQARILLVTLPTWVLLGLIVSMLLLFVSLISRLLIEQRYEVIAVLRSRGASRKQIFGMFITQHTILGVCAFITGPLLAILAVDVLAEIVLPANDQHARNLLLAHPLQIFASLAGYALLTALAAVLTGIFAIHRSTHLDVLSLRRQDAGQQHIPFWQRFYLDLFIAMLAISGYAIALYASHISSLDVQTQVTIISPLILGTASCTLVAGLLLFVRIFPFLLNRTAWFLARTSSTLPTLVLTQLTSISRQILSTTVLLALTTAFGVFTLLFISSQTRYVADLATYMVGADFSGSIEEHIRVTRDPQNLQATYRALPGVKHATSGYVTTIYAHNLPLTLKAIDTDTFSQTIIWNEHDTKQSLDVLTQRLKQERTGAIEGGYIPVWIDATTWNTLHLSPGQRFTLEDAASTSQESSTMTFMALGIIQSTPPTGIRQSEEHGQTGLLADYKTFKQVYETQIQQVGQIPLLFPRPNYFWLQSSDKPEELAALRSRLRQNNIGPNVAFYDRRAIIDILYHDPLYLNMVGVLILGTSTPLILAIIGCLIGSGLSIRKRHVNLTILRALGTAPRQLLGMLTWEQAPIYGVLFLLGVLGGWLLSAMILPALTLSSMVTRFSGQIISREDNISYLQSNLPTIQISLPVEATIALALLALVCLTALGLVIRSVALTPPGRALRKHEE